jgi:hypothetical protein
MDQNVDLRGMSPDQAKSYILAHITDLNLLKKRIDEMRADLESWKSRAALASSRGIADLAAAADAQAAKIAEALAPLLSEAEALAHDIETMKSQIPGLAARMRSVDPDLLLANLQMATGEMDDPGLAGVERGLKDAQADQSLAELKRNLGMEPPLAPQPTEDPDSSVDPSTEPQAPDGESR